MERRAESGKLWAMLVCLELVSKDTDGDINSHHLDYLPCVRFKQHSVLAVAVIRARAVAKAQPKVLLEDTKNNEEVSLWW